MPGGGYAEFGYGDDMDRILLSIFFIGRKELAYLKKS